MFRQVDEYTPLSLRAAALTHLRAHLRRRDAGRHLGVARHFPQHRKKPPVSCLRKDGMSAPGRSGEARKVARFPGVGRGLRRLSTYGPSLAPPHEPSSVLSAGPSGTLLRYLPRILRRALASSPRDGALP